MTTTGFASQYQRDTAAGPIVLWLDYGSYDGWSPTSFATEAEALAAIEKGETHGNPWRLTRVLTIRAVVE